MERGIYRIGLKRLMTVDRDPEPGKIMILRLSLMFVREIESRRASRYRSLRGNLNLFAIMISPALNNTFASLDEKPFKSGIVCQCLGISRGDICRSIQAGRVKSVKCVIRQTSAGSGCTACHCEIRSILAEHQITADQDGNAGVAGFCASCPAQ